MPIEFHGSPSSTVGVEIEFQVVDRQTRELVSLGPAILARFPDADWLKPELLQSTVEINTRVCDDVHEVRADLDEKIAAVRRVADELGAALLTAGTHPSSRWSDQKITEDARYHRLVERMQWSARRLLIFGLHVHVGVPDGETAIAVVNGLERWLPHLLALSASSPYWEGRDTGLASTRTKIFEGLPTAGLPYVHRTWSDFEQLVDALIKGEAIESTREIWWDVRPHPRFGTVEVRVCDAIPTLRETLAVVALVQALIVHLTRETAAGRRHKLLHARIVRENKWLATRWATRGSTIVDEIGNLEPISVGIENLLGELGHVFHDLRSDELVPEIRRIVEKGPSYERQRRVFQRTNDLRAVVDHLIREGEKDQPEED